MDGRQRPKDSLAVSAIARAKEEEEGDQDCEYGIRSITFSSRYLPQLFQVNVPIAIAIQIAHSLG